MYITCQQCDTIFRLDESLLKTSGSKVRCCQCRNVFVAYPPAPEKVASDVAAPATAASAVPSAASEAALDQELEGIDLAELDSILEQETSFDQEIPAPEEQAPGIDVGEEVAADLNEDDLNLDFTIEPEEEKSAPAPMQDEADFDIDDLDMDFDLDDGLDDTDTVAEIKKAAPKTEIKADEAEVSEQITDEELDLELEQLDLSLGEDEPAVEPEPVAEAPAGAELDLADIDLVLEDEIAEAETAEPELELSLDEDVQPVAAETDAEEIDDLDLSDLDSVLGLDDASDQGPLEMPEIPAGEDLELSLDDSDDTAVDALPGFELEEEPDLSLDEEPMPESNEEPALELEEEPSLDEEPALELEEELSLDEEPALELEEELSLDEEPELSLEEEPALELEEGPTADAGDDLDLSDLDAMLGDTEDDSEAGPPTDEAEELELELELEDTAESAEPVAAAEEELEDLSFELDSEFEDEPAVEQAEAEAPSGLEEEELDLSDIEQMLESDEAAATIGVGPKAAGSEEEGGERWAGDGEVELEDSDEFDLAEFEAAIDEAEGGTDKDAAIEEELSLGDESGEQASEIELELDDLKLEVESKPAVPEAETATATEEEESEELDLSDLEGIVEDQDASATSETIDTGDIELEFEISDESVEPDVKASQTAAADTMDAEGTFSLEETVEQAFQEKPEEEFAEEEAVPKAKKRRSSKGLLFLLILLLLGGAGYLFYAVSYMGLEIPYLSEYLNPKPKDPAGILNLATLDINSKFIENEKAGRLFIVTGKIRNGKDTARRMVRLQGKLFTKGKVLAKTEFTYAGVSLTDQEISEFTIADIKKKINSTTGPASAVKVLPGQSVPFMIVFSDLPEGLDEFAIEVISSMQAP